MSSLQVPTDANTLSTNWSNVAHLLTSLRPSTSNNNAGEWTQAESSRSSK